MSPHPTTPLWPPRRLWAIAGALLASFWLATIAPATADDGVEHYRALMRQYRNWEITSEEFNRRSKELIEKYGLTISPFGVPSVAATPAPSAPSVSPAPSATGPAQGTTGITYMVTFGLNGSPLAAVIGLFATKAECEAHVEAKLLAPLRLRIRNRTRAWFMSSDTLVERLVDKFGNAHWQITIIRCGPDIPGMPPQIAEGLGIDTSALVDQAVQEIRARGFDPG